MTTLKLYQKNLDTGKIITILEWPYSTDGLEFVRNGLHREEKTMAKYGNYEHWIAEE